MSGETVFGIDLSLRATGLAVVHDGNLAALTTIKSQGKKGDTYDDHLQRIRRISEAISRWFSWFEGPTLVVIEAPSYGSSYGNSHERAGLWWSVYAHFAWDAKILAVPPRTRAKYITGNGNSGKDVVLAHAIEQYVHPGSPRITNDNEADAVGLAAIGSRLLGSPVEPEWITDNQREALLTLKLP